MCLSALSIEESDNLHLFGLDHGESSLSTVVVGKQ